LCNKISEGVRHNGEAFALQKIKRKTIQTSVAEGHEATKSSGVKVISKKMTMITNTKPKLTKNQKQIPTLAQR